MARARAASAAIPYDLTASNPTVCDFPYPPDLLDRLRDPEALAYRPDPKGLRAAREAVAREYDRRGVGVDPDRVLLAASSSEAYAFLFKLLCDPGDAVLAPVPSYPLFEHLATLEGVRAVPYGLDPDDGWQPAPPFDPGPEAAILVHPNNPTGSWVARDAAERLAERGGGRGVRPLIVDEVFLDFPLERGIVPETFASRSRGLTFTLGGLSKSRGLPQLKLSWIVVSGPPNAVARAMERLEFIADQYLSVATPVQVALADLLERARPVQGAILERCRENLAAARALALPQPWVRVLAAGGGWSVVVRFPRVVSEEALALALLEERGVAVHPGYFFDFPGDGYLVASLLPPPAVFARGFALVLDAIAQRL